MAGILYVVYNESIVNSETKEKLYKIGITKSTVEDRYYGLNLKMPGEFVTLFAYRIEDYQQAEKFFHNLFKLYRNNGEWFDLNQSQLNLIKTNCEEALAGEDVKDKIKFEKEPIIDSNGSSGKERKVDENYDSIKEKNFQELEKIKNFFEGKGYIMQGPNVAFRNDFLISTSLNESIFFFVNWLEREGKYMCKYQLSDRYNREAGNFEKKWNIIKERFPELQAEFNKGRGNNPNIKIIFPINVNNSEQVSEAAFKILEQTKDIVLK
jgi:hypothetical protein